MQAHNQDSHNILIVEDEVLIADTIARQLKKAGHRVVGHAVSYSEAMELLGRHQPDLILLDIRLSGSRSGIDLAESLRERGNAIPIIFLTSQLQRAYLERAKRTRPLAYINKPVQISTLLSTVEVGMYNVNSEVKEQPAIILQRGKEVLKLPVVSVVYLKTEHVYVRIQLSDGESHLQRITLAELLELAPKGYFVQTHRSYAINRFHAESWDANYVYTSAGEGKVPISRNRRKQVTSFLES